MSRKLNAFNFKRASVQNMKSGDCISTVSPSVKNNETGMIFLFRKINHGVLKSAYKKHFRNFINQCQLNETSIFVEMQKNNQFFSKPRYLSNQRNLTWSMKSLRIYLSILKTWKRNNTLLIFKPLFLYQYFVFKTNVRTISPLFYALKHVST